MCGKPACDSQILQQFNSSGDAEDVLFMGALKMSATSLKDDPSLRQLYRVI
jgi:hypothetical protein